MAIIEQQRPAAPVFPRLSTETLRKRLADLGAALTFWLAMRRYRQEVKRLMRTSPHLARDIGLTPEPRDEEIARPSW